MLKSSYLRCKNLPIYNNDLGDKFINIVQGIDVSVKANSYSLTLLDSIIIPDGYVLAATACISHSQYIQSSIYYTSSGFHIYTTNETDIDRENLHVTARFLCVKSE